MFKLVKILNGRTNQPEPLRLPVQADENHTMQYRPGCLLKLVDGKLAHCTATDKPAYVCAELCVVSPDMAEKSLWVFPISSEMVFEAPVTYSEPAKPIVTGALYTLALTTYDAENELAFASGITDQSAGGTVRVYDNSYRDDNGKKILVTIPQ